MSKEIGKRIKELRTHRRFTLKDLSDRTGLSSSFLSQLERGLTSIATDSLGLIANALEIELADFFASPRRSRRIVLRSYEKELLPMSHDGFIHYSLSNDPVNKTMLPHILEILPINSEETISQYTHSGEEFVYVLEGTITLFVQNERYELYPGDSAHYSASIPHNWANYTNRLVRLVMVATPNPFDGQENIPFADERGEKINPS